MMLQAKHVGQGEEEEACFQKLLPADKADHLCQSKEVQEADNMTLCKQAQQHVR